ncbi:uncharacterized protein LOC129572515 [Sitodiplosis mosellana]|uniref:uncharacterized protein LOC129572515 n=1 Tax=Sitodiplosis mosellana TaxID=263140 RepID=UPI00244401BC|nr:uncharacterized protein LOC129572515 [Sitodiplosis mosellana]
MYRQIRVDESQTHLQRILWRESPDQPIKEFELSTVTYGTAVAPFLATRTLKQLSIDGSNEFPIASPVLREDCYMDDVLSGADSVEEAAMLSEQLTDLMKSGQFRLRKWSSNSYELLNRIPKEEREINSINGITKTLGICWSTDTDELAINVSLDLDAVPRTKRQLTSEIASLYDTLGYICPVVIMGKQILQKIWRHESKIEWDDSIPQEFVDEWQKVKAEIKFIADLRIPRWVNCSRSDTIEMHGFSDAAEAGYAAAIYIVNRTRYTAHLLVANARVSPIKEDKNNENVTIPRLELCGALLLAQMTEKMIKILDINFSRICLWSDSRIVLDWIHANPKRYKTFIGSRIAKINKLVEKDWWSHVRSEDNAADCASRGISPAELSTHSLWWNGPSFLVNAALEPPRYKPKLELPVLEAAVNVSKLDEKEKFTLPESSTYEKLKRVIALCQRFSFNSKPKNKNKRTGILTADELEYAEAAIIKNVQQESFAEEIKMLCTKGELKNTSALLKLSPFLDSKQVLRVGGRLKNADLPYEAIHQMLLPSKHAVTALIIKNVHLNCLHGAPKLTEAVLRQKFWVLNSQRTIKAIIHKCVDCFKAAPKTMHQFMADLPEKRVNISEKPFINTAVDYTGAIQVKLMNGRAYKTKKAYIAIFVCMSTKAIHVEVVTDMTAEAFIAA